MLASFDGFWLMGGKEEITGKKISCHWLPHCLSVTPSRRMICAVPRGLLVFAYSILFALGYNLFRHLDKKSWLLHFLFILLPSHFCILAEIVSVGRGCWFFFVLFLPLLDSTDHSSRRCAWGQFDNNLEDT